MTLIRKHTRKAHPVRGYFRNGVWVSGYTMPECEISSHFRRI